MSFKREGDVVVVVVVAAAAVVVAAVVVIWFSFLSCFFFLLGLSFVFQSGFADSYCISRESWLIVAYSFGLKIFSSSRTVCEGDEFLKVCML